MLGHRMLRFTSLLTVMVSAIELWAGPPVRGRSQGDLAIKAAADGERRVHQVGDLLPVSGEARTSANGPAHLQSEQGTLSLLSLARIRYDLTAQGVEVLHGRLFCQANGDRNWTIQAAALQAQLTADPQLAQDINWQLHQAGFQFNERLTEICDLFNATQHPERTIEVLEAVARTDRLSHSERMGLAAAYEAQNRNLDARRARSGLE